MQTLGAGTLEEDVVEHGLQQPDTHPPLPGEITQISWSWLYLPLLNCTIAELKIKS